MCGATGQPTRGRPDAALAGSGFTLLELIIVLAILVMLMAMVWPVAAPARHARTPCSRPLAQLVRDLARARMAAIDSGQIMALRYEPGGRRYVVTLAESLDDDEEPASESTADTETRCGAADERCDLDIGFDGQLEEDVVFRDPAGVDDEATAARVHARRNAGRRAAGDRERSRR